MVVVINHPRRDAIGGGDVCGAGVRQASSAARCGCSAYRRTPLATNPPACLPSAATIAAARRTHERTPNHGFALVAGRRGRAGRNGAWLDERLAPSRAGRCVRGLPRQRVRRPRLSVAQAIAAGAVAVICERPIEAAVASVVVPGIAQRLGQLGRRFHAAPSREMAVVGVTGTNGKTTVAYNIARIMDAGGYIGTLGWGRPPALCASDLTTAAPLALQAQLRALHDRGRSIVALETSSHALHQGRVDDVISPSACSPT